MRYDSFGPQEGGAMIAGMTALTFVHVLLSLVGILAGLAVVYGFLTSNSMSSWTLVFLVSTVATCVTGFVFPFNGFTPALGVGILTLGIVAAVIAARYIFR